MAPLRKVTAAGLIGAAIIAQVILPAAVDLILSLVLVGAGGWVGWKAAQSKH